MKKKLTVTSNPVTTMYGSGACAMIKRVIDVTVSAYRKKKNMIYSVIIEYKFKL